MLNNIELHMETEYLGQGFSATPHNMSAGVYVGPPTSPFGPASKEAW